MTELMSFNCPHCKIGLKAPYEAIGRQATCNKCGKPFMVPAQFDFENTAPTVATGAPQSSPSRIGTGPVFVKPEPKPKPKSSASKVLIEQFTHIASLAALPVIALMVLGAGVWWFLSMGEEDNPVVSVPTVESNATPSADASLAMEVARLKKEQERKDQEAAEKKSSAVLSKPATDASPSPGKSLGSSNANGTSASADAGSATIKTAAPATGLAKVAITAEPTLASDMPKGKSSIADLVELYGPSVVVVKTNSGNGAGFLAFAPDLIITNYHVVSGATSFQAIFFEGKRTNTQEVAVVAVDPDNDLALLKLRQPSKATVLELADSSMLRAGAEVFAIGNPGIGNTILSQSVSNGIISNTERIMGKKRFLQTNTAINPGNSGGPLFDLEGKVVGVVTAKATRQENIGFAVPASLVADFYRGRDSTYRVEGDFVKWEGKQPFERLRRHAGAIALNTYPTDMLMDVEHNQLVAISSETNKVIFISLKERKVIREIFTGTDPIAIKFGLRNELWVANRTSKNLVTLDRETGKTIRSISLQHEPLAFTVGRNSIWFMDSTGEAIVVKFTGKDESKSDLLIRSLAIYGSGGDILCGSAKSWLCEFDPDKVQTVIARRRAQKKAIDDFNADARSGSNKASEARREALIKELADTDKILDKAIKVYNQPAGTDVDFSQKQQSLFIDEPRKRIYFNRCVMDLNDPSRIIGVFKSPQHSLKDSEQIKAFFEKFPFLNQIRAVSPDGTIAVSGTHLYNTADFTIIGELPLPSTSLAFHPDNTTLYLGDSINRQVVGINYRELQEVEE